MKIDDFLDNNRDISINEIYLKDSIFFKVEDELLDDKELKKMNDEMMLFVSHYKNLPQKESGTIGYIHLDYGQAGCMKDDSFRLPFDNIVIDFNEIVNGSHWIVKLQEDDKKIKYSYCYLCELPFLNEFDYNFTFADIPKEIRDELIYRSGKPKELRMDFYYDKELKSIDFGDTFLKGRKNGATSMHAPQEKYILLWYLFRCLKIIQILNCKNVSTIFCRRDEKLQRSRIKKGKMPLFSYYTLVIKLPNFYRHKKTGDTVSDTTNRIHLCRGHFKTYSSENPLFGKYVGKFWWQPIVRGNNFNGIIFKDYTLKTP